MICVMPTPKIERVTTTRIRRRGYEVTRLIRRGKTSGIESLALACLPVLISCKNRSTKKLFQHAIGINSSLGCSHSDAEKVISTLAQHFPDLRERIILRKQASRMVELKRSTLRARSSINSAKASQSTASEKTSYLVRKYSLNMGFYLICSPLLTNWVRRSRNLKMNARIGS